MPPPPAPSDDTDAPRAVATFFCFRLADPAGQARLMMVGELDLVTAERAEAAIRRAQDATSVLTCDLGDVWFVDLSGLRVLLDAAAHAQRSGGRLTLANCPRIVPRMLRVLALDDALDIRATLPSPDGVAPNRRLVG